MHHRLALTLLLIAGTLSAQDDNPTSPWKAETFEGLELRGLGPAFMSGRIADIAIHPDDENLWYVAVGSGGVWKTHQRRRHLDADLRRPDLLFDRLRDHRPAATRTCIWVGTGENVGGRHVGFGDGIYRSATAARPGHRTSGSASQRAHLGDRRAPEGLGDTLWVAAPGAAVELGAASAACTSRPTAAPPGRRTLGDEAWVGATDLAIDPRDPDRLYAATWQRHRTVAAYLGGGPAVRAPPQRRTAGAPGRC